MGEILPELLAPSVMRTMILLLASRASRREAAAAMRGADGGALFLDGAAVVTVVEADFVEGVAQPLVIERDRAGVARAAGEGDEAHAVVGPAADEIVDHRLGDIDASDALAAVDEIVDVHGKRDIEGDHDVDAAGGAALVLVAPDRAGHGEDGGDEGEEGERQAEAAGGVADAFSEADEDRQVRET